MTKYYQPELWEFHIGFEYLRVIEMDDDDQFIWEDKIFPEEGLCTGSIDAPELVELYYNKYLDGSVRVKYLDKEDIESLGFKVYEGDGCYYKDWMLDWYPEKDYLLKLYKKVDNIPGEEPYEYYFQGIIKNKSELKRILKQVGIYV